MAYFLYKKIKASRAAKAQQDLIPLGSSHSSPFERTSQQQDGRLLTSNDAAISTTEKPAPSPETAAEKRRRRIYRWKLISSLFLPYMLATIDLTIVATAVPFIASHFNELDELNWIVTAFTLTSTALIPTFGQLADVFGRHATLQLATLLMLIGSVLCAAAQTWGMLLLGRALQGMSSAGLMTNIMIILADNVTLEENAKNNSIFAFVGGVAYSVGPVIGGYLTDSNWRYCFVISIPIAFVSHFIIFFLLRKELKPGTWARNPSQPRFRAFLSALLTLDLVGTILFIFGVGLIILGTAWGGSTYPWVSSQVLAPLIVGGVCFFSFFGYEYILESGKLARIPLFAKQKPMLPYSMFKRLDTLWLAILQFAAGAAMYSVFYYVGVYFTLVLEYPASRAGVQLLYYIPGLGAGVYLAMFMCNIAPAQTFYPLALGTLLETLGLALVTWGISSKQTSIINGMMVLAGAGTGIRMMPANLHAAGIWPDRLAAALSLMRFALPFGGTVGITIMGSVFNNKLGAFTARLGSESAGGGTGVSAQDLGHGGGDSLDFIAALPDALQEGVRNAGKDAIMWAYIAIMPILGISLVTGLFMGNVWIRKRGKKSTEGRVEGQTGGDAEDGNTSEVIYVPYLYAVFKGVEKYKHVSRPVQMRESDEAPGS
ncbi:major facilitator superfamily domain-containing protein [Aspergillus pseudoustus]|uniref:Major facilitator superfamily domain-containing protein n=1 Tax=Aspergillus pseudoustus TaxID=1810923 RepID=A0ABR4J626_9EURO